MKLLFLFRKLLSKLYRELYRLFHPRIWGKRLQINGIPYIVGSENLILGFDVSINEKCYLQCSGGLL